MALSFRKKGCRIKNPLSSYTPKERIGPKPIIIRSYIDPSTKSKVDVYEPAFADGSAFVEWFDSDAHIPA